MNQPSSNPNNTLDSSPAAPTPSNSSTQNETSSPSSVPTPEPTATATTAGLRSNITSNTSSSQETATSQPSTNTSESSFGSTKAHPRTTISLLNSTSTHAESPSQLSVGDDDAHDSPALDPLLAGLVSAFIITAVIIALLLFLKLRKRDSGPQFHRLQDLPMQRGKNLPVSMDEGVFTSPTVRFMPNITTRRDRRPSCVGRERCGEIGSLISMMVFDFFLPSLLSVQQEPKRNPHRIHSGLRSAPWEDNMPIKNPLLCPAWKSNGF
ncbi:hypothetical protein GOODEAATRI_003239 [Goodea atripinnis]|uniref:Uncharacterized protein n=1 Tax=Goodea atripinnis TaxID=208336 RepID=A0ABV0N7H0_9TELE